MSHKILNSEHITLQRPSTTHTVARCGDNVLADIDSATGVVVRTYVTPMLDANVSMTIAGATPTTYYYNADERRSVMNLTDSTGAVAQSYGYSAYGDKVDALTSGDVEQRYTYTGRELSAVSSDYYFRYRWYGAASGSFLTRDPLGYIDGMSVYVGWFAININMDDYGLSNGDCGKHQIAIHTPVGTGFRNYRIWKDYKTGKCHYWKSYYDRRGHMAGKKVTVPCPSSCPPEPDSNEPKCSCVWAYSAQSYDGGIAFYGALAGGAGVVEATTMLPDGRIRVCIGLVIHEGVGAGSGFFYGASVTGGSFISECDLSGKRSALSFSVSAVAGVGPLAGGGTFEGGGDNEGGIAIGGGGGKLGAGFGALVYVSWSPIFWLHCSE